jgi:phage gpG-like protein
LDARSVITILVDSVALRNYLRKVDGRLRDLRTPNRRAAKILLQLVRDNYDAERTPWGGRWRKLSQTTLDWRRHHGFRAAPRLNASGYLRASLAAPSGRAGFDLTAAAPYADIQQFGNKENELFGTGVLAPIPARAFFPIRPSGTVDIPDRWWDAILPAYNEILL